MTDQFMSLKEIVNRLEWCNYENEVGLLVNNVAFIELKRISEIPTIKNTHDIDWDALDGEP